MHTGEIGVVESVNRGGRGRGEEGGKTPKRLLSAKQKQQPSAGL